MSGRKPGQAEVQHLDLAVGGQHEVRRLDVAMDQPVLVDGLQADGRLAGKFGGVGDWNAAGRRSPALEFRL